MSLHDTGKLAIIINFTCVFLVVITMVMSPLQVLCHYVMSYFPFVLIIKNIPKFAFVSYVTHCQVVNPVFLSVCVCVCAENVSKKKKEEAVCRSTDMRTQLSYNDSDSQ